jgi:PAS domain S-box-containing protein
MPGAASWMRSWRERSYVDPKLVHGPGGNPGLSDASSVWLVALALGVVLFMLDSFTLTDGAASALYGGVLIILAERRRLRIIVAAASVCVLTTALSYFPEHGLLVQGDGIFRRAVSLLAVVTAAVLTLRSLVEQDKIDEQLQLLQLTNSALFVRAGDGLITYWSPGAERLYGWPASETVGRDARQLLGRDLPGIAEVEAKLAASGRWQGEVEQTSRDGRRLLVSVSWAVQRDERGRAIGVLETGADVTQRRQSEQELARSEERYRAIFNTAGIAIFEEDYSDIVPLLDELSVLGVLDRSAYIRANPAFVLRCVRQVSIVDVNDSAIRMFRANGKQDLLQSLSRIYLPGSTGSFAEILVALAEGKPSCTSQTFVRTLDGQPLTIQMSITFPHRREKLSGVLVSIMDVTERYQAEEDLARARESLARVGQVSSLGEMVASIAHEMNQPLAAIVTNAEAALRWLGRGEPDRAEANAALERIAHEAERAVQVLQQIRSFLGHTPSRLAPFDLKAAVEEAAMLLRREFQREDVGLIVQVGTGLPLVLGDRIQVEQVLTNLLINAIQALSEVTARPRTVIVRALEQPSGDVAMEVQDNGPGIPAEQADQIFRPFFTTKVRGIGLGLPISRSIIESHGGRISISGAVDDGTIVRFTLPVARGSIFGR